MKKSDNKRDKNLPALKPSNPLSRDEFELTLQQRDFLDYYLGLKIKSITQEDYDDLILLKQNATKSYSKAFGGYDLNDYDQYNNCSSKASSLLHKESIIKAGEALMRLNEEKTPDSHPKIVKEFMKLFHESDDPKFQRMILKDLMEIHNIGNDQDTGDTNIQINLGL